MPHFVLDCSEEIFECHSEEFVIEQVHSVANASGLFDENDIKVRLNPFKTYSVGNRKECFIHVFTHIMQGRTTEQKAELSHQVVSNLVALFPDIPNIAMNISDFEKATYCNRTML
ncbi:MULTISPECIES: 5-carboxymethyl-2-hydroxymuconate Delta-isomerase [Vibrio]|uniref:5-carboxymethyl-2-hydroxymuconate Delta-isomerase n=1 Tax=Vibrio TaxID=662 RepID=UPI003D0B9F8B